MGAPTDAVVPHERDSNTGADPSTIDPARPQETDPYLTISMSHLL